MASYTSSFRAGTEAGSQEGHHSRSPDLARPRGPEPSSAFRGEDTEAKVHSNQAACEPSIPRLCNPPRSCLPALLCSGTSSQQVSGRSRIKYGPYSACFLMEMPEGLKTKQPHLFPPPVLWGSFVGQEHASLIAHCHPEVTITGTGPLSASL
jgi:hypothetical protein